MSPEQLIDALDCGRPNEAWAAMIQRLNERAQAEDDIAVALEREARDKQAQAEEHYAASQEFHNLALALERASVTLPAEAA